MKNYIISIDGPAASGKERIAKYISKKWKLKHLDSGLLYRRLALIFIKEKININSSKKVKEKLSTINKISFKNSKELRTQNIGKIASKIAVYKIVRKFVNEMQYDFVRANLAKNGFVIDGRDIGLVVFKNANLKLYIDVKTNIRAKRRYKQLIDKGEKSIYQKILKDIELRDKKDKTRKFSPLIIPKGAIIINNNGSFKNTIIQIESCIKI